MLKNMMRGKSIVESVRDIRKMETIKKSKRDGNLAYVSDGRYRNDTMMAFFSELLQFYREIRTVAQETGNMNISIRIEGKEELLCKIEEGAVSEQLVQAFFMFYSKNDGPEELYIVSKGLQNESEGDERKRVYRKNQNIKEFQIVDVKLGAESDLKRINKIIDELETMFIDEQVCEKLRKAFSELKYYYSQFSSGEDYSAEGDKGIAAMENKGFQNLYSSIPWNKSQAMKVLEIYYGILTSFICEDELIETEGMIEKVLIPTLNLGMITTKSGPKAGMTMPVVLHAMNLVYDKLDKFLLLKTDGGEKMENCLYHEIFLAKLHQMFRFYLIQEENQEIEMNEENRKAENRRESLCQAALPASRKEYDDSPLGVPVRSMSTYNSFQGIGELRLADKILYEAARRAAVGEKETQPASGFIYRITVFGDVRGSAMRELFEYIEKQVRIKPEYAGMRKMEIRCNVYTLRSKSEENFSVSGQEAEHRCKFLKYQGELLNQQQLRNILESTDLLFVLDSCDLYRTEVEAVADKIIFRQRMSFGGYARNLKRDTPKDLLLGGRFVELYHVLTMYASKNQFGFLRKKAKEEIVKFIRKGIESQANKAAYIYISDIEAFQEMECIKENIVRIETYNQKEIGIIRFVKGDSQGLPEFFAPQAAEESARKHLLVFNMWQVIKHIVLNQREYFKELFLKDGEKNMLDQIYLALDYSNWRSGVKISYYYEEKDSFYQKEIQQFIFFVLQKAFGSEEKDIYQKYLKKVMISILYGSAKSTEDLLFVYLLKDREELIGKFRWLGDTEEGKEDYNPEIVSYYNQNCKYTLKKNYWDLMRKFDCMDLNIIDKYTVFETIKKTSRKGETESGSVVGRFLEEILRVCKEVSYSDSMLYENCLELRKNNFGVV